MHSVLTEESLAHDMIAFWDLRGSLLASFGLPNEEKLWNILLQTGVSKKNGSDYLLRDLSNQIRLSLDITSRYVQLLCAANLLRTIETANGNSIVELLPDGEELVDKSLKILKNCIDKTNVDAFVLEN
ncbi:MAG: hypothetical protein Pars2KO_23720 [Parasphingorhabdus sp.]